MKLILFDIDGTILLGNGSGRRLIEAVLSELCQHPISTDGVSFSGRTDPLIMRDALKLADLPADQIDRLLPRALEIYAQRAMYRRSDLTVLPGVRTLLARLEQDSGVQLGLLTGNLKRTAYLKLQSAGLLELFPFGAFGSDHANRSRLPAIAAERARKYCGNAFTGHDIVIVGDSINDVHCGRSIGAFSVAVATGFTPIEDLAAQEPNVLLRDLTDSDLFIRRVVQAAA